MYSDKWLLNNKNKIIVFILLQSRLVKLLSFFFFYKFDLKSKYLACSVYT